ncbi:MAG: 4Fe-4S dicluster domain-containing protein [Elusimicrobia bacterium]|nr:4Fe-4S dicluster domain-containing protein [Elusimicrobiota bacterium]
MKKVYCNVTKCLGCRSCEIACAVEHSKGKTLFTAISETPLPVHRRKVQAVEEIIISDACHHCEDAPCITACMSGSMFKAEDGSTQHNEDKCVGCWMCVMVCPFGAISRRKNLAIKCDLCKDRTEGPVCVVSCPTKSLTVK